MGVELRFLRQRNSRSVTERHQMEDALVSETQKRRVLEEQIQMLVKTFKDRNAEESGSETSGRLTNQQQEAIFSRQREEVLLGVVESLRVQLDKAEADAEKAKLEWQEERARYQETHDLLRFQIDQLTLTRGGNTQPLPQGDEVDEKVEEVMQNYERKSSRQLNHTVSVHDFHDKPTKTGEVEPETREAKPKGNTTTTAPTRAPAQRNPAEALPGLFKQMTCAERMKVFFLSSFWWPKLDFLKTGDSPTSATQPLRPPVLLLQIAWWVAELREYVITNHMNLRFLPHSNQFCNCDDCVKHIASYAINKI